jgi:hypothetical protein
MINPTKKINKEMTISDLAVMMEKGFKKVNKTIEKEIEGLALMAGKEFNGMGGRFDKIEKNARETKDELKSDILGVKADINKKVDTFTHKELEFRVEKVEEKVGIARKK